jgi:hypothetical protein
MENILTEGYYEKKVNRFMSESFGNSIDSIDAADELT